MQFASAYSISALISEQLLRLALVHAGRAATHPGRTRPETN